MKYDARAVDRAPLGGESADAQRVDLVGAGAAGGSYSSGGSVSGTNDSH